MKRVVGVAAGAAAVVAILTGCGGDGNEVAQTVTVTESSSPSEESTTAPPSTTNPPSTSDGERSLGDEVILADISFTVSEVKTAASPHSQLPGNQQWWSVMVEGCPDADDVSLSWGPWSIQGDDGGNYPASDSVWGDFPEPQYSFSGDRVTPNGKCAKGWVMVALNADVKPATVEYGNTQGENVSWKV